MVSEAKVIKVTESYKNFISEGKLLCDQLKMFSGKCFKSTVTEREYEVTMGSFLNVFDLTDIFKLQVHLRDINMKASFFSTKYYHIIPLWTFMDLLENKKLVPMQKSLNEKEKEI